MLRHKQIDRICCIVLASTLLLTCAFMGAAAGGLIEGDRSVGYENLLFDQSRVHTIDIVMNDWEGFLETCTNEEYVSCSVVIDGESMGNVAIRAKGNTSLSSVRSYGNNRYSFKIEFDHYESGKSYHGLDKLSLNNLIQDATAMKDYLAYTLMNRMGAAAPLCSYVQVNVNGEPWGLYLAVEAVEDSFLTRNYGSDHGELYKPDSMSMGGGRGNGRDFDMSALEDMFSSESDASPDAADAQQAETKGKSMNRGGFQRPENMQQQPSGTENGASMDGSNFPQMPGMTNSSETAGGFDFSQMPGMTGEGFDFSQMPGMTGEGFDFSQTPGMPDISGMMGGGFNPASFTDGIFSEEFDWTTLFDGSFDFSSLMTGDFNLSDYVEEDFDPSVLFSPDFDPTEYFGEDFEYSDMLSADFDWSPLFEAIGEKASSGMKGMGGGFGGMGSSDVMLQYSDDDPSSYRNIFESAKTDVSEADQTRLIESLKKLSEGESLEEKLSAVDAESVIRYLVVHHFMENGDSYTGSMIHNYYLYEEDGQLSLLPWDYNLAFGAFSMGGFGGSSSGATSSVNAPIDTPVTSGDISTRPILSWIFESEEYTARYHELYQEFVDLCTADDWLASEIARVSEMIAPYVEADENGFFSYEEFTKAIETLKEYTALRVQSIEGQLSGSIPSTREGQTSDSSALIDASHLNVSDMGAMNMGGGFGGERGGFSMPDRKDGGNRQQTQSDAPEENGSTAAPDDTINPFSGDSITPPDGAAEQTETVLPETTSTPALPDGMTGQFPGGNMTPPDGMTGQFPGGNMTPPDGTTGQFPGGNMTPPDGMTGQFPGGNMTPPDGTTGQFPGGNMTPPMGNMTAPDSFNPFGS